MGSSNGTVHHLPRAQKLVLFGFSFLEFSKSKFSKKADEDWTTITISALPLINLLELLTVNNVYRLHALRFTHLWHKNFLPNVFYNFFKYAGSLHTYNTRYAASQNLYKKSEQTLGNKLYPLWLPSFGIIFLLIWKILMSTNFLNKLSCISSLNNLKIHEISNILNI